MSHDLKHLVGAIETLIMPEGSGCGSCQSRHALGLRALVSEIRMLGERFLAFYRLDMGVNRPQLRSASLIEMLNQLKEESEPLLAASGRGFELVVPEADCWVYTDKLLFKIILRNFIANAIKYASTGNLGLTVDLTEDRRRAKIRILDHGPGLGPALGERAFDLFSRGDSAPGRSGHGIGLFMVAYYARRLHCEVGLEEAYRDGACFWISIPRANQKQIQRELKQQAAASQLIQTLEAPLSGLRIAVIRLPGAADYLRKWGAEVHLLEAHASFGDQWPRFNAVLIGQPEHESPIAGLAEGAGSGAVPFLMAAIAGKDGLPDVFCPLAFHRWPISPPRFKAELLGIFKRARLAGD